MERANDSVQGAIELYREMFPSRRIPSANVILNASLVLNTPKIPRKVFSGSR